MPTAPLSFSFAQPYRSAHAPVFGQQAVATSNPAAALAGLRVLEAGGNAIDAAVAVLATLSVAEPTMNGIGGDLFAQVWDGERLHALNASGRAPRAWTLDRFSGRTRLPELGWDAVTVPGLVSGWAALWRRFGSRPFGELLAPAVGYAREGFPVLPRMAELWAEAPSRFAAFPEFMRVFLPHGRAPRAGEWFKLPELAESLASIADTTGETFYRGELARRIASAARDGGSALTLDDLAAHRAEWVEPIGCDFHGLRWFEPPPNGQGLAALIALGILEHLPLAGLSPDEPDSVHYAIEAMKLAFRDAKEHVADPEHQRVPPSELLESNRLAQLAAGISRDRSAAPGPMPRRDHGTVYATVADRDGRMVSAIQSNYLGFGSGVVVPGTGISLHNRGLGFSLDPAHANVVRGGARPYHTIMPGFALCGGRAALSFGVMGAHMQPQGQVQLALRMALHGQNPQAACDAPRFFLNEASEVALEPELEASVGDELARRGHRLVSGLPTVWFGGAQVIAALERGYCAGSDPRKDGQAVAS